MSSVSGLSLVSELWHLEHVIEWKSVWAELACCCDSGQMGSACVVLAHIIHERSWNCCCLVPFSAIPCISMYVQNSCWKLHQGSFFLEELCLIPKFASCCKPCHVPPEMGLTLGCPFLKELQCGIVMPQEILTRRVLLEGPQIPNVN